MTFHVVVLRLNVVAAGAAMLGAVSVGCVLLQLLLLLLLDEFDVGDSSMGCGFSDLCAFRANRLEGTAIDLHQQYHPD